MSNSSLGSASDRSASVSSQSAHSLASGRSMSRARRDARDAKRVLRTIKQVKEGEYRVKKGIPGGKYLIHRQLHPSGYKLLREVELKKPENSELSEYFYGDEIRYDYTRRPYKGDKQLVIHVPSGFHEIMAGKFSDMIVRWLGNIANGSLCRVDHTKELTMEIAGKISSSLAKRVKPSEPRDDRLEPDLSFRHEDCRVADMVVEVAWSQSKLQLPDRARRYIEGTKGAIQTVIGLNMNDIYDGGRRATFSFWRCEQDGDQWKRTTVVDNMEFIDGNGQAVDECMLSLSLRDFICSEEATEFGDFEDVALKITSKTLYEFYVQAFKAQIADEATEKIEEVQKKANCASERILAIDNFIRERGTRGVSNRILMERKQLADIRAKMAGLKDESAKIASLIGNIEAMMDMVGDRVGVMRKVEKDRVAAARKVAEVETELARLTAEEGNWAERSIIRSRFLIRLCALVVRTSVAVTYKYRADVFSAPAALGAEAHCNTVKPSHLFSIVDLFTEVRAHKQTSAPAPAPDVAAAKFAEERLAVTPQRSICTPEPLRAATRVSSGFTLSTHNSQYFASEQLGMLLLKPARRHQGRSMMHP
ncbi:hypothetical protein ANO14919_081460 [Xylariales sp. No.14919]|nr:hypothetical protein ANO14919_081460 [Xylariales sp. No.14919]